MSEKASDYEQDLFSFPRRFDLASMLAISTGYSILFAAVRLLDGGPFIGFAIGGLLAAVAVGQAVLMGGEKPREASVAIGGVYCSLLASIGFLAADGLRPNLCFVIAGSLFWGPPLGYLAGTLVGGVFLVADHLRRGIAWLRGAR